MADDEQQVAPLPEKTQEKPKAQAATPTEQPKPEHKWKEAWPPDLQSKKAMPEETAQNTNARQSAETKEQPKPSPRLWGQSLDQEPRPRSQSAPEKARQQPEAPKQNTDTQSQAQSAPQKFVPPPVDYSGNFMGKSEAQRQATPTGQQPAQANNSVKEAAETTKKPGSSMRTNLLATAGLATAALFVGGGFPVGVALAGAVIAGGLAKTGYDSYRRNELKKEQKNNKTPEFTPPNVDYSKATELMNRSQAKQAEKEFTPPNVDYSKANKLMEQAQATSLSAGSKGFDHNKANNLMNQAQAAAKEKPAEAKAAQPDTQQAPAGQKPGSTSKLNTQFRPEAPAGQKSVFTSQLNTQFRPGAPASTTPPEVNNQVQAKPQGTKGGQSQGENSVKEVSKQSPHFEIDKKPGVNSPNPTPNLKQALNRSKSTGDISK